MNSENEHENLSESRPEISAVEAALAQLRPRRETRFADEVKSRMKDAMSDQTPTVKIPLTHYIRIAQFNAAVGGLAAGLFLGVVLGAGSVYFAMSRVEPAPTRPAPSPYASLTALERTLLEELDFAHEWEGEAPAEPDS